MRMTDSLQRVFKTAFLLFIFFSFSVTLRAQGGLPMDTDALSKLMSQNQKNGLPAFYKIYEQYSISFDDASVASKYKEQLVAGIKNISGVINCSVDLMNMTVNVQFPKETEKQMEQEHIAEIKALMDAYHLRMISYKQATYHN
ncbi:MAG: hypothetical protein JWP12_3859 [Bacteroidetes bacterium]|nr:hypothetical protein [Bacteroidota bacterium]